MDILKILQITTDDSTIERESFSDDKWLALFEEIGYDSKELNILFSKIPDLGEVILKKLLKCEDTGFFTIKGYFDWPVKCAHSLDVAEIFSVESGELPSDLCWKVSNYLVDVLGWYTPDHGYTVYKYKSDYDRLDEEYK